MRHGDQKRRTSTSDSAHATPHPATTFPFFFNYEKFIVSCWLFFLQSFQVHFRTKFACAADVRRQKSEYVINPGHFLVSQMVIIKMAMTITFINELGAILLPISPACCSSPVTIGVRINREEKGRKMKAEHAEKVPWTTLHLCIKHLSASSLFLLQPHDSLNNKIHCKLGV